MREDRHRLRKGLRVGVLALALAGMTFGVPSAQTAGSKGGGDRPERGKVRDVSPEAKEFLTEQYFELPSMMVTMGTEKGRPRLLFVELTLVFPNPKDASYIEFMKPKMMDVLQTDLRKHNYEKYLDGNAATIVKATALDTLRKALHPVVIDDVLINNLLVQ